MEKPRSFLLVDDDPIFLAVAESVVQSLGDHSVTAVDSAEAGLAAIRAGVADHDFIILDLNMPGLDGLGFMRAAAELGFGGSVIISSGEHEAVLRSARVMGEMLRMSILGALRKPLSPATLATLLAEAPERPALPATSSRIALPEQVDALELLPYYQAQHSLDGSIVGLEALIRVRAGDGQIHGPGKLFGLIHAHDELLSTTLAIAGKVFDDLAAWTRRGLGCRVSINVDAAVVEDVRAVPALIEAAAARNIDRRLVCIELTETALPKDMSRLIESLARLRITGFDLSLDDYGTGVSNFELLRLCPFTEIKIDGTVIRSALNEPVSRHFLQGAMAMAAELGMEVVCEGIETEAQLELARRHGVTIIQGFLFSKPMPAEAIELHLRDAARPKSLAV